MRLLMLVCHCNGITESEIRLWIRSEHPVEGPVDALVVARRCGAGQGCGGCVRQIVQIVADEQATRAGLEAPDPLRAAG